MLLCNAYFVIALQTTSVQDKEEITVVLPVRIQEKSGDLIIKILAKPGAKQNGVTGDVYQ